jgi:hypothetical protein
MLSPQTACLVQSFPTLHLTEWFIISTLLRNFLSAVASLPQYCPHLARLNPLSPHRMLARKVKLA